MKEIIGAVVVAVGLWQGIGLLRSFHNTVRQAALEKATQGLPSLSDMNRKLHMGEAGRRPPNNPASPGKSQ